MSGTINPRDIRTDDAIEVRCIEELRFVLEFYDVKKFLNKGGPEHVADHYKSHDSYCILPKNNTHSDTDYLEKNSYKQYRIFQFDDIFPNESQRNYEVWYQ